MAEYRRAVVRDVAEASDDVVPMEGLFRQYIEATPLGVLVVDSDGVISYVNQSLCECFGYEAEELLGQPIEILVPDSVKPDHVALRDRFLSQPEQRLMQGREIRGRRKNGAEVAVAIGLNPLIDGTTVKVACTVMDLSESRRAEETLANFFDLSLDLFCIANLQGYFLRVNRNFPRLLGYSDEELLNRPFFDFIHADDIPATQEAVAVLASGQPVVRFRNRYRKADGSYVWIEWNARVVSKDGVIFGVGRDVTDEINFQKELLAREQRERTILENTPAVVYVKSIDGKYVYVNQRYSDLFSLDRAAVLGKTDYEIFPKVLADKFRQIDRQVVDSRRKTTTKEIAPHVDGLHTYVSVKFPLFDAQGDVSAVAGISTDITEDLRNQEFQGQLKLATAFQRKLYPLSAPTVPGLDISGSAIPATQLCGDYYDFIVTGAGRIAIAVGDVSGHGFGSALAMVEVRSILRGLLHYGSNARLSDVVRKLNELLFEDLPEGCFVSLFLAEIDVVQRRLQYAGAGHQASLVHSNGAIDVLKSTASVVGLLNSATVRDVAPVPLNEDDLIFICTDGVTEAINHQRELFGVNRAADCIANSRHLGSGEIIQRLFSRVIEFTEGRGNSDDMTAVVAKLLPLERR